MGTSNLRITTTTALNVPLDDTLSFVNYHLNCEIDHMYLFFDNPRDEAIAFLKDNEQITCFRCNAKY